MADQEQGHDVTVDIQEDLNQLIMLGLVNIDGNGGLVLTKAGIDAINKINAQTFN